MIYRRLAGYDRSGCNEVGCIVSATICRSIIKVNKHVPPIRTSLRPVFASARPEMCTLPELPLFVLMKTPPTQSANEWGPRREKRAAVSGPPPTSRVETTTLRTSRKGDSTTLSTRPKKTYSKHPDPVMRIHNQFVYQP